MAAGAWARPASPSAPPVPGAGTWALALWDWALLPAASARLRRLWKGAGPRAGTSCAVATRAGELRGAPQAARSRSRSEEHTSELQSLAYLVCRLLLEKKKYQT